MPMWHRHVGKELHAVEEISNRPGRAVGLPENEGDGSRKEKVEIEQSANVDVVTSCQR